MGVLDFKEKNTFYVITSPNDVITSKVLHHWKALIEPFHMRYYSIWFVQNKNLTFGRSTSTLGARKALDLSKVAHGSEVYAGGVLQNGVNQNFLSQLFAGIWPQVDFHTFGDLDLDLRPILAIFELDLCLT